MANQTPTISGLRARAVEVPIARPLATSGGSVSIAPLVLIDLETKQGIVGRAYVFYYASFALAPLVALIEALGEMIVGDEAAPLDIEAKLQQRFRLLGAQGFAGIALSGIDMAAWDIFAKAADQPLVRALGAAPRPIPAYNSNGLGIIGPDRAAKEAAELAAPGFGAIKVRLGYPDIETDLAVIAAVRGAVPAGTRLVTDYNQSLSVAEAIRRIARLDALGLDWVEEPTRFDDYAGHAEIRAKAHTPIQLGENCWGPPDMLKALEAGACDLFMPDAGKFGGVTGWLRASALAGARELPISSHLYPEVSVHLLAAAPSAHWLEYVDWANPILDAPIAIEDGNAVIPERPGIGLEWNERAVKKYLA